MAEFLRLTRSNSTSSTSSALTVDSQTPSDNAGSRESAGPAVSAAANQQFSGIPQSPKDSSPNTLAPQKPFPFRNLPVELQMSVVKALKVKGRDRLNFSWAGKVTHAAAQTALTSKKAVHQIRNMPINDIDDLNTALQLVENINADFRHEPMQSVADKLIFLSRQDSEAGKEAFMQKATPFIHEGNELDQAIKFFDWSRSVPTVDQPNLSDSSISSRQGAIEWKMRYSLTARQAVEFVVNRDGQVNSHDMDLFVQHARGLEVDGLPNLPDYSISSRQGNIEWKMREGLTATQAVKFVVDKNGQVNSHDRDLLVQHARGLEVDGLPNLSDYSISIRQGTIKSKVREGLTARQAVEFVVNRTGQVNTHDMDLLVQHAQNFRP